MDKTSSLKSAIKGLITEVMNVPKKNIPPVADHPKAPFELIDPIRIGSGGSGDYYIVREFPLRMTTELADLLNLTPEEREDLKQTGDVFESEFEMSITPDVSYEPGTNASFSGHPDKWSPGDPESFDVNDYVVRSIYLGQNRSIILSTEDGRRMTEFLGELTETEIDTLRDTYMENMPGRDDYEPDYYD